MRALVGIDSGRHYQRAMKLLARLRLEGLEAELIHADVPLPFPVATSMLSPGRTCGEPNDPNHLAEARALLAEAQTLANDLGLRAESKLAIGTPAQTLMERSAAVGADLLVLAADEGDHTVMSLLFGTTGRLTLNAKTSVLLAKEEVAHENGLTAVFVTDHCANAEDFADQICRFGPKGLAKLVVLTTLPGSATHADVFGAAGRDRERQVRTKSRNLINTFRDAGISAEYRVLQGDIHHGIAQTLADVAADLLIVTSACNSFLTSVLVGAPPIREALASPCSVLVLRR